MTATTPEVSVVCSTYQRAARLPEFLAALEAQTFDRARFEVVIVDDGSTDNTSEVLNALAMASPLDVRIVALEVNRGRAGGRNAGWRAARAPIVAFTDDDCAPDPAWLAEGVATARATGATIVVGRTEPNPAQSANDGAFSRTQRVTETSAVRYMHTCNIFYRRADLEAVDGFDERFNAKGGEDTDLGWRVLDRGGTIAFAPGALVLHDITVGSFRGALREAAYWRDIPLCFAKHPERARSILIHRVFWKKTHERVVLGLSGALLALIIRNPLPLIGALPWIRYRVYKNPIVRGNRPTRVAYLPHAFLIDTVEVATMVRGSIRNRTFVL